MQITASILAYAAIVCGAVVSAACAEDRKEAVTLAAAFAAAWMLYLLTWTPYGAQWIVYDLTGYPMQAIDVWSLCNMLCGLLAFYFGRNTSWGVVLTALFADGCVADLAYWQRLIEWEAFRHVADMIFLLEASAFYATGGLHATARLGRFVRRHLLLPLRGTRAQTHVARHG